jgi:hypothetical protein
MSTDSNKPGAAFWVIGVIALIWNGMGVMAYLAQAYITDDALALLPEAERALYNDIPAWATAAFAIAVFGGALASLVFLMRKKLATLLFTLSFIGIVVQMVYNLMISKAMEVYGPGGAVMPVLVILIGLFLVWYSKKATANGWLS